MVEERKLAGMDIDMNLEHADQNRHWSEMRRFSAFFISKTFSNLSEDHGNKL
jgi:hypothetical protein